MLKPMIILKPAGKTFYIYNQANYSALSHNNCQSLSFFVFDLNFNAFKRISTSIIICLHGNLFKFIRDFVKLVLEDNVYGSAYLCSSAHTC